ncbi:11551_t:CDS:2, partial [Acaulospora morrowiae]
MDFRMNNEDPSKWSVGEVCEWIQTLGVQPYVVSRFREAEIDGQKLMNNYINYNFLKDHMNIENYYDQFNIVMSIALLHRNDEQTIVPLVFPPMELPSIREHSEWPYTTKTTEVSGVTVDEEDLEEEDLDEED